MPGCFDLVCRVNSQLSPQSPGWKGRRKWLSGSKKESHEALRKPGPVPQHMCDIEMPCRLQMTPKRGRLLSVLPEGREAFTRLGSSSCVRVAAAVCGKETPEGRPHVVL